MMNQDMNCAVTAYRRVATMVPPTTAIVLLFDQLLMLLQRATKMAQAGQAEESYKCVCKATAILRGLSHVLDFKRGGAIAEMLRDAYTRNIMALNISFGRPDMGERYVKIGAGLSALRDSWAEVSALAGVGKRKSDAAGRG